MSSNEIRFAIHPCSLGLLLVAQSDKGLCAVLLDDEHEALRRELRARFPSAVLVERVAASNDLTSEVVRAVEDPTRGLAYPLDLRGSTFQCDVWHALREIPSGSTTTYTDLAIRIGRPHAVRAVAQACATNPLAVVVPCHRVLRRDGQLSGYRWGIERKRALLAREGRVS